MKFCLFIRLVLRNSYNWDTVISYKWAGPLSWCKNIFFYLIIHCTTVLFFLFPKNLRVFLVKHKKNKKKIVVITIPANGTVLTLLGVTSPGKRIVLIVGLSLEYINVNGKKVQTLLLNHLSCGTKLIPNLLCKIFIIHPLPACDLCYFAHFQVAINKNHIMNLFKSPHLVGNLDVPLRK